MVKKHNNNLAGFDLKSPTDTFFSIFFKIFKEDISCTNTNLVPVVARVLWFRLGGVCKLKPISLMGVEYIEI